MDRYSFKTYVEWADFGFERNKKKLPKVKNELPSKLVNIETVMKDIQNRPLGIKPPTSQYFSECQWGNGTGSVKIGYHSSRRHQSNFPKT